MSVGVKAAYERFLLNNLATVKTIESSLRNVTWLLPGRFEDAELASEGLYALLALVASHHDSLLASRLPSSLSLPPRPFDPKGKGKAPIRTKPVLPPASDHTRYTRYWMKRSSVYRRTARALATIGYVQLLVEMLARKKLGSKGRWRIVVLIEAIKTVLRLVLLVLTRRPVLEPSVPQREIDPALLPDDVFSKPEGDAAALATPSTSTTGPEDPSILSTFPKHAPLRSHLYPLIGALPEECLAHPLTLLPEVDGPACLAEVLSISATLVQLVLMLRSIKHHEPRRGDAVSLPSLSRFYFPFVIGISMRLAARQLRPRDQDSLLLYEYYAHLDRHLASTFFLTGPMWVGWTRPKIMGWVKWLERWPLVGYAGDFAEGYLSLVDEYFYYTSS